MRWRRAARVMGALCLAGAAGIGGYVLWLLWGTGIAANSHASAELAAFYASASSAPAPTAPAVGREAESGSEPHAPSSGIKPALHTDFTAFPVPPSPSDTGAGTWGVLHVPAWRGLRGVWKDGDVNPGVMPIADGTGDEVLNQAWAGRFTDGARVGEVGNFSLAGHRRTHGENFLHVPDLRVGDYIGVETAETWYVYQVISDPLAVPADDVAQLAPVPGDSTFSQPAAFLAISLGKPRVTSRKRPVWNVSTCTGTPDSANGPNTPTKISSPVMNRTGACLGMTSPYPSSRKS